MKYPPSAIIKVTAFLAFTVFLLILVVNGCDWSDSYDSDKLKEDAYSAAIDKSIDEEEFIKIYNKVLSSEDQKIEHLADKKALYQYLVLYLSKSGRDATVWNPVELVVLKPFNFNVFLENSASMDGYVEGVTDFENSIYDMLGNIKTSDMCDSLNLNYINSTIPYTIPKALSPDIEDFIKRLDPTTFRARGGDRSSSDLSEIIQKVLEKTDDRNLSILISDFVFSPGSGANAQNYLNGQKVSIRVNLTEKLKKYNLALAIYQMQSQFKGDYYDQNNKPHSYHGNRPFYIWIIGTETMIKRVLQEQLINNSDKSILNKAVFTATKVSGKVPAKIVRADKVGDFRQGGLLEIIDAEPEDGKFSFSIAANFNDNLRDQSYFSESENYILSNSDYKVTARILAPKEQQSSSYQGFSHLLQLATDKLVTEDLTVKVISRIPDWVTRSSSVADLNINGDVAQQSQTFGLKHLFEGVSSAFNSMPDIEDNVISELTIKIKKD